MEIPTAEQADLRARAPRSGRLATNRGAPHLAGRDPVEETDEVADLFESIAGDDLMRGDDGKFVRNRAEPGGFRSGEKSSREFPVLTQLPPSSSLDDRDIALQWRPDACPSAQT